MTALLHTSRQAATTRIRTSGFAILAAGLLACLGGLIPTAFVLLTI